MSEDFENFDDLPEKEPFSDFEPEYRPESEKEEQQMASNLSMDVTDSDKLWAFLAYVLTPIVPIIIMLMEDKKQRPFLRAHNGQALAWGVINLVIGAVTPFLCGLPSLLLWLIGCYWGWQAYQGQMVTIPVVSDFIKGRGWA
jgi:uncharacterized protein